MKYILSSFIAFIACSSFSIAATINFSAAIANNAAGANAADLGGGDLIEVGTWDGSTFSFIGSGSSNNVGFGSGFFSNTTGKIDTSGASGSQLALQWTEAASGYTGIVYYDITTGLDSGRVAQWTLKGGDGGGLDNNVNGIDLADLTLDIAGAELDAAAVLVNVEFSGSNIVDVPSFNLQAVPEPSAYAALAGLLALGVVTRRRA